jgi:methionyl aminopeptidase
MSDDTPPRYTLKSAAEIAAMRTAGEALAAALLAMKEAIVPGKTTTLDLDRIAGATLARHGAKSALLGYKPGFSEVPYLHNTCISLGDEVIHGVPDGARVIREGDLVSLDCAAMKDGWCADSTISVLVGKRVSQKAQKIWQVTRDAMYAAIAQARPGNKMGEVSGAMQKVVEKNGMSVVRDLVGHGIGRTPHEEGLDVPCYAGSSADEVVLEVGMTFCIEPMVIWGGYEVCHIEEDPWTIVSADGTIACHWEHTVAVTETGPVVLTSPPKR